MLTRNQRIIKRLFDVSISIVLLGIVIIPLILLTILATINTGKMGLFVQIRIGQFGRPFRLYKIRSLKNADHKDLFEIKRSETKFGGWLRRTKLDEFPQLFNVIKGDMSLVGPRPDIEGYADCLKGKERVILSIKPGITGPASIKYRDEDNLLLAHKDPNFYNDNVIWPDKVKINIEYLKNWSLKSDIGYLIASVIK